MRIFVTADQHYGHSNIIRLCDRKTGITVGSRQFEDVHDMNVALTHAWNSVVGKDDLVYVLGDFCFKSKQGDARTYADLLNGRKVFIKGNHDKGNHLPTEIKSLVLEYGGETIAMTHDPKDFNPLATLNLCGHVHGNWTHIWGRVNEGGDYGHLIINVGVDVNDYMPVSLDTVIKQAQHLRKFQTGERRKAHNLAQQGIVCGGEQEGGGNAS